MPHKTRDKLVSIGLLEAQRVAASKALADHLKDWQQALTDRNNSAKHVRISFNRVNALVDGCRFLTQADVQASRVETWLAQERRAGRLSITTSNYYLRDTKSFFRWLVEDGRADRNTLQSLKPLNVDVEDHRQRRCLPDDDFQEFLAAARCGSTIHRIAGPDRLMLYSVAGWTGLRAQELASLQPESFNLDVPEATVTVRASYSKHKKEDVLPVRADLADVVRDWLRGKPAGQRLWPGGWWNKAAEMVRADLAAAKQTWIAAVPDPVHRRQREIRLPGRRRPLLRFSQPSRAVHPRDGKRGSVVEDPASPGAAFAGRDDLEALRTGAAGGRSLCPRRLARSAGR